jgi:PKD repeat protein
VVKDGSNSQVYPGSGSVAGNPFVLPAGALGAGSYSAIVTGTNGHPPDAVMSHAFSLAAPSAITFNGPGGAPACTNCTSGSPPFGTVTLDASTSGATEYSWDFGDGIFRGYANGDQAYNIPNPSFTYTSQGPRSVRVKVRNCAGNELISQTLSITINQIQALTIDHFAAQCPFGVCAFSAGAITFDVQVTGGADRYEYDWTGQGLIWDTTTGPPVDGTVSHVYAAGDFVPKIRVKRGAEPYVGPQSAPAIHVDSSTPPPPPPVSISVTGSGGQINQALTFTATPHNCTPVTGAWTWNTGGGADVMILDITGVSNIDTDAAQHLRNTVSAVRVLGARCIITGIRGAIAQTLVHLGITLEDIETRRKLSDALQLAMDIIKINR